MLIGKLRNEPRLTSCNIPTPEIPFKNPPKRWEQLFGIDFRTLALFRIGIALAILVDLWITWPDINLLLTDSGFYPRHISSGLTSPEWFHIFYLGGDYSFIVALFAFTALAALALMFGYYTRAATVICWLMVSSFNLRFVIYLSAADTQLNVMLFWAMFLPLGARFSVDRALALDPPKDERTVSAASIGLLLQVAYLYFMGALLKTNPIWTTDYGARRSGYRQRASGVAAFDLSLPVPAGGALAHLLCLSRRVLFDIFPVLSLAQ